MTSLTYFAIRILAPATAEQVERFLAKWPASSVRGAICRLARQGAIQAAGTGRTKAGRTAKRWVVR